MDNWFRFMTCASNTVVLFAHHVVIITNIISKFCFCVTPYSQTHIPSPLSLEFTPFVLEKAYIL